MAWSKVEAPTGRLRPSGKARATLAIGEGSIVARLSKSAVEALRGLTQSPTLKIAVWNDPDNATTLGFALDPNGAPVGKSGSFSARGFYLAAGKPAASVVYDLTVATKETAPFTGFVGTLNVEAVVTDDGEGDPAAEATATA